MVSLAAAALDGFEPHIVPAVYGWDSPAFRPTQGWILQELMPGAAVDEVFDEMPTEDQRHILGQMAKILHATSKLPDPGEHHEVRRGDLR
jgi:hypothetical protein